MESTATPLVITFNEATGNAATRLIRISQKTVITLSDIADLDILGLTIIASEFWERCDEQARKYLLTDTRPFVQSAAIMSRIEFRVQEAKERRLS